MHNGVDGVGKPDAPVQPTDVSPPKEDERIEKPPAQAPAEEGRDDVNPKDAASELKSIEKPRGGKPKIEIVNRSIPGVEFEDKPVAVLHVGDRFAKEFNSDPVVAASRREDISPLASYTIMPSTVMSSDDASESDDFPVRSFGAIRASRAGWPGGVWGFGGNGLGNEPFDRTPHGLPTTGSDYGSYDDDSHYPSGRGGSISAPVANTGWDVAPARTAPLFRYIRLVARDVHSLGSHIVIRLPDGSEQRVDLKKGSSEVVLKVPEGAVVEAVAGVTGKGDGKKTDRHDNFSVAVYEQKKHGEVAVKKTSLAAGAGDREPNGQRDQQKS